MSNVDPGAAVAPVAAENGAPGVVVPDPPAAAAVGPTVPNSFPAWVKYTAKAVGTVFAVALAYLISVLQAGDTLADVSLIQWLTLGYLELGAFGLTYWVANGPKPGGPAA